MPNLVIAALAVAFFLTFFAGFALGWLDRDREVAAKINSDGALIIAGRVVDDRSGAELIPPVRIVPADAAVDL
ncbi:MAG: hypothetical protein KGL35_10360 [Bradyrhizobium sp.]|nr:hypothetical protein [Bradyrhizobium sp.]